MEYSETSFGEKMSTQFKNSKLPSGFRPASKENTNQCPHRMLKVQGHPHPEKGEVLLFKSNHEDSDDKMSQKCIYKMS